MTNFQKQHSAHVQSVQSISRDEAPGNLPPIVADGLSFSSVGVVMSHSSFRFVTSSAE